MFSTCLCVFQAEDKCGEANEKLTETNKQHDEVMKRVRAFRKKFENVKNARLNTFTECFNHVANQIDVVYKVVRNL